MRFHFGFSKFIKPSKLLYWLGLGFFGLLAWIGLTQQEVLASQTFTNFKWCGYTPENVTTYYSQMAYGGTVTNNLSYTGVNAFNSRCDTVNNGSIANYRNLFVATKRNINDASNVVFQNVSFDINYNFCGNLQEQFNSIDMFFTLNAESIDSQNAKLTNSLSFNSHFPTITNYGDLLNISLRPLLDNDISLEDYYCHIDSEDSTTTTHSVICEGVPFNSHTIGYTMTIENEIYATASNKSNVFYINDNVSEGNNRNYIYGWRSTNTYSQFEKTMDYQCSYVEPSNPQQPLFEEDGRGNSNIVVDTCEDLGTCVDIPNDTIPNFLQLVYPNTFTQFLEFPLYLAQALVNNHGTCHRPQINFSSFTRRFGGFDYILFLPCLSTKLQSVFSYEVLPNLTMYDLIDHIIAFYLLYKLAMRCIMLINMAMSGQDLVGYLFSGTEGTSSSDPIVHNGEVAWKTKKFTRRY